jgi:hypothetical protein
MNRRYGDAPELVRTLCRTGEPLPCTSGFLIKTLHIILLSLIVLHVSPIKSCT